LPRSHGYRRKTRHLLKADSGKPKGLTPLLREYKVSDKVVVDIDPKQVRGMPHRRFQGKVGIVQAVRRRTLTIIVPIGDKEKKVITRLEHVKPLTKEVVSSA
jgi:large subunit ribosomal protein L21e